MNFSETAEVGKKTTPFAVKFHGRELVIAAASSTSNPSLLPVIKA